MNSKTQLYSVLKHQAIALRSEGKTLSEIQVSIGQIPKSTLSTWLKGIELTDDQRSRIRILATHAGSAGRQKGAWVNQQKRILRLAELEKIATSEYSSHLSNKLFAPGLALYMAEGTKKTEAFVFMNSDIRLVELMILWTNQIGGIKKESLKFRLYIHELYKQENCEDFWIERLHINKTQLQKTIYKPTGRAYKKNPNYKGCLRLEVPGSDLYWKTMTWWDCFFSDLKS